MTVDDHDMNVRVRTTRRVHDDRVEEEQRWKQLPALAHGRREMWMLDRAKNALGTAKLASIYLNEERGRICRLRKIKSVLASGTSMGNKKIRTRPGPNKSKRPPGYESQSRVASEIYRRYLPDRTIKSRYPNHPPRRTSTTELPVVPVEGTRSPSQSLMSSIDKGKRDSGFASRDSKALPPLATDTHKRVNSLASPILKFGGGSIEKGMGAFPPYVPADILNHDGHYRLKVGPSHKACSSFHVTKDSDQAIRSGPSALDLYYQNGLWSDRTIRLEENVNTTEQSNSGTPNVSIPGNPTGNKVIAAEDPLTRTVSAARPLLFPAIASSDLCGRKARGTATSDNNTRDRNIAWKNQVASGRKPFALVSNSTSALSTSQKSRVSPKGRTGNTRMTRRTERDLDPKKAESRTSRPHRLDPAPVETKVAAVKPERVRRRWKSSEGSISPPSSQIQEAPKFEGCANELSSERTRAQGRLQNDKDLDALKSEHSEALSILQHINCLSVTATKPEDDGQKVDNVAVEGSTMRKVLQERSDSAAGKIGDVEAAGVMVDPNAVGEKGLSASPPRITSRDEAAQRLMYRKWWSEIAKGENAFSSLERSRKGPPDGRSTPLDGKARRAEMTNDDGGDKDKRQALAPKH